MKLPASRDIYQQRLHKVLRHIDDHLDQPLDLAVVAETANFSPFHFHRLFSTWMGETFGDYLRRRRVESAARRLISQPRLSVLDAALSVGFGSAEAFTRAFKAHFDCSPSAYRLRRKNSKFGQIDDKIDQDSPPLLREDALFKFALEEMYPMQVTLIERNEAKVAYLRYQGPYGEPVSRFWQEVFFPWAVTNQLIGLPRYGISHDDPTITTTDKCRYDAGVEFTDKRPLTGNAQHTVIAGGRYASAAFRGTAKDIAGQWAWLLSVWLPDSGLQLDNRPCFEYYSPEGHFNPKTGEFSCELCIPVAPL